jgi:hypothetical protein
MGDRLLLLPALFHVLFGIISCSLYKWIGSMDPFRHWLCMALVSETQMTQHAI